MKRVKVAIGVLAIIMVSAWAVLLFMAWHWGALTPQPRVSTAGFATNHTALAVIINLDPVREVVSTVAAQKTGRPAWLFQDLLPYEGALLMDVPEDRTQQQICLAVSPKRLGPFVPILTSRLFSPHPIASFQWSTPGIVWQDGVLMARLAGTSSEDTMATVRERWPDTSSENITLEGGHVLEAVIDNRGGRGLVAVEGLANLVEGMSAPKKPAEKRQELQRIFDAQQLSGLFYRASVVRLTADMVDRDTIILKANMECSDEQGAAAMEFALLTVRDLLFSQLIKHGVVLEGDPVKDGSNVRMELRLTGCEAALAHMAENEVSKDGRNAQ